MSEISADMARRLNAARRIARDAGRKIMDLYAPEIDVVRKADNSPVTIADREAERLMGDWIAREFPHDSVLGEEHGQRSGTSAYRWILDPIDGTKSFIAGVPLFGTMIGVQCDDRFVLGVIEFPALNQRIFAAAGGGAWYQVGELGERPARVSSVSHLRDGLYVTSEIENFAQRAASSVHRRLESEAWYTRTWGDCYGYYLVATGRAAVMIDPILNLWDAAALLPIMLEAGGRFTSWDGTDGFIGDEAVGSNGHVHDEVIRITKPFARRASTIEPF